jgi:SulP family sulfate permease
MVSTVVITVVTHNLAIGVIIGIVLSTVFFSRKIAQLVFVDKLLSPDGNSCTYSVSGQLSLLSDSSTVTSCVVTTTSGDAYAV